MKLLILCVDGLDHDRASEHGFDVLPYSSKLSIPKDCFIETGQGLEPATGRVWPTIFTGRVIDYQLIERRGARMKIHNWLVRNGARQIREKLKKRGILRRKKTYTVGGWNEKIETVFSERDSFIWNIPTLVPEWIVTFPDFEDLERFTRREYEMFEVMANGFHRGAFEVVAIYTRVLDVMSHIGRPQEENDFYDRISRLTSDLVHDQQRAGEEVMVISDHGIIDGFHTDSAYMGATFPFEAESILDVRRVIEEVIDRE